METSTTLTMVLLQMIRQQLKAVLTGVHQDLLAVLQVLQVLPHKGLASGSLHSGA